METATHDKLAGRWFHKYLPTQANRNLSEFKTRFQKFTNEMVEESKTVNKSLFTFSELSPS
jgi:hypothetical protein